MDAIFLWDRYCFQVHRASLRTSCAASHRAFDHVEEKRRQVMGRDRRLRLFAAPSSPIRPKRCCSSSTRFDIACSEVRQFAERAGLKQRGTRSRATCVKKHRVKQSIQVKADSYHHRPPTISAFDDSALEGIVLIGIAAISPGSRR